MCANSQHLFPSVSRDFAFGDDNFLNVRGPFINTQDTDLMVKMFDNLTAFYPVTTMDLQGLINGFFALSVEN